MSGLAGEGVLAIWNDVAPEARDEFLEWHTREHLAERLRNPGFLRARRYIATDADIEFFTLYETDAFEDLVSPAYRQQMANPTAWSRAVVPSFRNNLRGVCRVISSLGHAAGAHALVVRVTPQEGASGTLTKALQRTFPALVASKLVTAAHCIVCDRELSAPRIGLQNSRPIGVVDHVILVECLSQAAIAQASAALTDASLVGSGASGTIVRGRYALECTVLAREAQTA